MDRKERMGKGEEKRKIKKREKRKKKRKTNLDILRPQFQHVKSLCQAFSKMPPAPSGKPLHQRS
jgi:hypothetical protein